MIFVLHQFYKICCHGMVGLACCCGCIRDDQGEKPLVPRPSPPPMAALPSPSTPSLPSDSQKANEEEQAPTSPQSQYNDLISTLPVDEEWGSARRRIYQGVSVREDMLPAFIAMQRHFKARPTDVLLATCIKSGTTWLKALAFATTTRTQYPLAHHPLLIHNPHQLMPHLYTYFATGQISKLEAMPSPRILPTHLPYSMLPGSVHSSGCRTVYLCRDPKDVLVSWWHFNNKMIPATATPVPFAKAFELFCDGAYPFGAVWDHALQYWEESLRRPEKVLFLKYEETMEKPAAKVKRLAEFLGCPFSREEENEGVVEEIISLCSFQKLSKLEVTKAELGWNHLIDVVPQTFAAFFRKGEVGDWRNYLSPEMGRKLDHIIQQKLEGSGLTLGRVD